jgi:hypothetical protein
MNLDNIEVGQIINGYKKMCNLLGDKYRGSDKRGIDRQERNWKRFFDWTEEKNGGRGKRYIIVEIYDEPYNEIEYRGGSRNNIEYILDIEMHILDLLVNDDELLLSKWTLLNKLKMINWNYSFGKKNEILNMLKISKYMQVGIIDVQEFYERSASLLVGNLEKALNNLENNLLINWSLEMKICFATANEYKNERGELKVDVQYYKNEYDEEVAHLSSNNQTTQFEKLATNTEKDEIRFVEIEVMTELDLPTKQQIVRHGKWSKYKERINEILKDRMNILYFYDCYKINIYCDRTQDDLARLMSVGKNLEQNKLNYEIINRLQKNTNNRLEKARKESEETLGEIHDKKLLRRLEENYLENQLKLIDTFINIDHKVIHKYIRDVKL